jgi:hypothetical protein
MTVQSGSTVNLPAVKHAQEMSEWDSLSAQSIEVEGYSQLGGKENELTLKLLEGVPFIIQNVTFRPGDITPEGHDGPRDYVSVECVVHPDHVSKFPRKYVIFNDGSTGIYRQCLMLLERREMVQLPTELPESGDANTTRYDISVTAQGEGSVTFSRIDAQTWYLA